MKGCRGRNLFFSTDVHMLVCEADIIFVKCHTLPCPTAVVQLCRSRGQSLQ